MTAIRKALGHIINCKEASRLVSQRQDAELSASSGDSRLLAPFGPRRSRRYLLYLRIAVRRKRICCSKREHAAQTDR